MLNPQPVKQPETDQHALSVNEQLDQIFAAQAATVHLLAQAVALLRGMAAPLPDEEADQLIGTYLNPGNGFTNIANR